MENNKESTNFVNFGTYKAEEADILKYELEKIGVPVKVIYPASGVGREATANSYFPAYQLLIRFCDLEKAKELTKKFNIKPIETGEKMPLPEYYMMNGLTKYSFIAYLLSFIAMIITGYLSNKSSFIPEDAPSYFIIPFTASFFIWLVSLVYQNKRKKG